MSHLNRLAAIPPAPAPLAASAAGWSEARVVQQAEAHGWRLDDGRLARQAVSCLLLPRAGDTVAVFDAGSGPYLTHVLARPQPQDGCALLGVPGARQLAISQARLALHASEQLALSSLGNVELVSAASVSVTGADVQLAASRTLVQHAQHLVSHVQHCVLQVAALLRVHGRQTLITADQDLKLDAERVSLG